jgi:hypothetical protein
MHTILTRMHHGQEDVSVLLFKFHHAPVFQKTTERGLKRAKMAEKGSNFGIFEKMMLL